MESLRFAQQYTEISEEDINIIRHSCKSILSCNGRTWEKKDAVDLFDIPMGSFHGAEVCDLVGLYLLNKLSTIFDKRDCGLYRDDGLAIVNWTTPRRLDGLRKNAISIALEAGFKITIDIGHTKTDFLDVSIDLTNNTYKPYRKKNAKILYINKESNHPIHIKTGLPRMIEKRLKTLSKDEEAFNSTKVEYDQALRKSGYEHKLSYQNDQDQTSGKKRKRNRRRKCIYYNPPYCRSTKTNVGRSFLRLVDKHFDEDHIFRRAFNRSTIKVSYSCLSNVKSIIQSHNKSVIENNHIESGLPKKACNCKKEACPLDGACLTEGLIYEAKVTAGTSNKIYIGSTGRTFKSRYGSHKYSFEHPGKNETELSKHVWSLKNKKIHHQISWKIVKNVKQGKPSAQRTCSLCNAEKMAIAHADKRTLLNTRSELNSMCPHFKGLYFKRIKKKQ